MAPLRVGYVPEHFSSPLFLGHTHHPTSFPSSIEWIPCPSGTGHMSNLLASSSLDLAIGLTEGWIAALSSPSPPPYRLVGEYVTTPLRWAISTGPSRDITPSTIRKLGVSRIGSGSYVMGYVLAEREGWVPGDKDDKPYEFVVLDNFANLRKAVSEGQADAFMWEYFTSKKYYDNEEIKMVGDIYTPWPSWHVVAREDVGDDVVEQFLGGVQKGVEYFNGHQEEAVEWIAGNLDYSREDAVEWLKTVRFTREVRGVRREVVEKTVGILKGAGVISGEREVRVEGLVRGELK